MLVKLTIPGLIASATIHPAQNSIDWPIHPRIQGPNVAKNHRYSLGGED